MLFCDNSNVYSNVYILKFQIGVNSKAVEKGPGLTQAQDQFFEKGLENLDFYVVKNKGP